MNNEIIEYYCDECESTDITMRKVEKTKKTRKPMSQMQHPNTPSFVNAVMIISQYEAVCNKCGHTVTLPYEYNNNSQLLNGHTPPPIKPIEVLNEDSSTGRKPFYCDQPSTCSGVYNSAKFDLSKSHIQEGSYQSE